MRAFDWSALGCSADPTPGDLAVIDYCLEDLLVRSQKITQIYTIVVQVRNNISSTFGKKSFGWQGESAQASVFALDQFAQHIQRDNDLIMSLRSGMFVWRGAVEMAQWRTQQALQRAQVAQERLRGIHHDQAALFSAEQEILQAMQSMHRAKASYDEQAQSFVGQLHAAAEYLFSLKLTHNSDGAGFSGVNDVLSSSTSQQITQEHIFAFFLTSMSTAQIKHMLLSTPDMLQRFWKYPPEALWISAWWEKLSPGQKRQYMRDIPQIIGNLPGIPYADRDASNRQSFKQAKAQYETLNTHSQNLVDRLEAALYKQGNGSAYSNDLTVVSFCIDHQDAYVPMQPMLAIAYGNPDEASQQTWLVAGMNSDAQHAASNWAQAAQNLRREQDRVDTQHTHAVISWLGYDTPDVVSVMSSSAALVGSARLAKELDGNYARNQLRTQLATESSHIAVVGHSYGTTTAADALMQTKHKVNSFTLVGSAGIDHRQVPSFDVLQVERAEGGNVGVYTTLAQKDWVAPIGTIFDRIDPNLRTGMGENDPYKAQMFSSEATGRGSGTALNGVGGHNILKRSETSKKYGYFEQETTSLRNVAHITTGHPENVVSR